VEVGAIERSAGGADDLPSRREEIAALRRQLAELESRLRQAERRAAMAEDSQRRAWARIAAFGRPWERP
jgi:hypothetical protein